MSIYITIDGGTTNTRINLVNDRKIIDSINLSIGAYANIEKGYLFKNEIKSAIERLLNNNSLKEKDIVRILVSGMITSEFGLCKLEHIRVPAGIAELCVNAKEMKIEEISSVPIVFICGVKTIGGSFENCDIMRGEETELMGIANTDYGKCVYVLPGSHTKIIKTDEAGRIVDFTTMLTGEMIKAISQNTILKDAVKLNNSDINSSYLLKGYDYCCSEGINKSLFKARILKNVFNCTNDEIYSFFMGTVLCDEIKQIQKADAQAVILGGKAQIKEALSIILRARDNKKIITLDDDTVKTATVLGAIRIFENDIILSRS